MPTDPPSLYLGLDAGGTRTRLHGTSTDGRDLLTLEGPGANPRRIGVEASAEVLARLIRSAQDAHPGHRLVSVVAGVAGIGRPADHDALLAALHPLIHPVKLALLSDAELALAAAFGPAGSGVLVIAGTGSIVMGRTLTGEVVRAGGWGYLLGDEGGGYRIGLAGMQAIARAYDGGTTTTLVQALNERVGLDTPEAIIQHVYTPAWSMADIAPLVLEAATRGDLVSRRILHEQTANLADLARLLMQSHPDITPKLRFTGGLTEDGSYAAHLANALQETLPGHDIARLTTAPVEAALTLAKTK